MIRSVIRSFLICLFAFLMPLLFGGGIATWAVTLHTDDFASGTMNWTGGAILTAPADGGPDGAGDAFLQVQSVNHLATYNSTANWTGDYDAIGASLITADLMNTVGSQPLEMRIVLFGPGSTSNRWTSTNAVSVPADGIWRSYSFSLAEDDLTDVSLFGSPTYSELMTDVMRVMFRHDPGSPSSGGVAVAATLGIDNAKLSVAGDYNDNGVVDTADYAAWLAALGGGSLLNEVASPGVVDAEDYAFWKSRFGAGAQSAGVGASIPEPTAEILFLAAAVWMLSCRKFLP